MYIALQEPKALRKYYSSNKGHETKTVLNKLVRPVNWDKTPRGLPRRAVVGWCHRLYFGLTGDKRLLYNRTSCPGHSFHHLYCNLQVSRQSSSIRMSLTTTTVSTDPEREDITPGDIVAVQHGQKGRQEGLVIGSHVDYFGRQVIQVQLDGDVYYTFHPRAVTKVKRLVYPNRVHRTVERRILW